MKNKLREILFGKGNVFNGLIALIIVGLFVLGCNCNKQIGDLGKKDGDPPTNTTYPTNTATPKKEPTFTKADASKKEIPSDAEMQEIVKTTLLDFNDAVKSADFTTFHSHLSKTIQRQVTPDQIKQKFQLFINGQMDISSISSMKANFTSPAKVVGKTLNTKGTYPTAGITTEFELQYVPEGQDWILDNIKIVAPIKKR